VISPPRLDRRILPVQAPILMGIYLAGSGKAGTFDIPKIF
jgi:hypothetical protein